jgi:hypothetical protein
MDRDTGILYINGLAIPAVEVESLVEDIQFKTAAEVNKAIAVVLNGKTISCPEDTAGDGV